MRRPISASRKRDPDHGPAHRRPSRPRQRDPAPRPTSRSSTPQRITDLSTARHAVAEGMVDMVGMTRAHIADPHIVAQADARPGGPTSAPASAPATASTASMSAATRCASTTPPPAASGPCRTSSAKATARSSASSWSAAGPAGLEAARVCGRRAAMPSSLLEATAGSGGQVNIAARLDRRREITAASPAGSQQRGRAGRGRRPARTATPRPTTCWRRQPDVIIVATGGTPNTGFFGEGERSGRQQLGRAVRAGRAQPANILVYDENGQHQGPSCAEFLAKRGAQVDLVAQTACSADEARRHQLSRIHCSELYAAGRALRRPTCALRGVHREGNRLVAVARNMYTEQARRAARRPYRGRARHPAGRRALFRPEGALDQPRRDRPATRWSTAARSRSQPTPDGGYQPCSASATPSPAATSTRRSTTRCACARTSSQAIGSDAAYQS